MSCYYLDIARRVNSKMAGHELGQAANTDALKWMPGRCGQARSLSVDDQTPKHFDLELHSGLFYECACPDCVCTYQCLASISGKLDITRRVNSKMAGDEHGQAANSDA